MTDLDRLRLALADRYLPESQLGEGGMATVYLAQDLRHDRKVALKVLRPELAAVIGADRFLAEIKTTANLQHPHILPLYDSGRTGGQGDGQPDLVFYVMPFMAGESLRDRLARDKQLPVDEAVRLTREVASALDYAHRQGVIHRDIKPENILIHDGQALVADFGIALAVSSASGARMTETGLSLGTPHYMSPEQAMGERTLSPRSDVYALGATLYEMLVGEPPFTGPTAQAVVAKVVTENAPLTRTGRKSVPPHVEAAVAKALEKLPADRFGSAAEFAEALARPGLVELPAGATASVQAAAARRWDWRLVAALGLAAVSTGVALRGLLIKPAALPVSRFTIALPEGQQISTRPWGPNFALSSDGTRLVYVGRSASGQPQLWLRSLDQLTATPIPGTQFPWAPIFSPDGQSVAFTGFAPVGLHVVSLTGGPPVTIAASVEPDGGDWTSDGWVYFVRAGEGISRVRSTGGEAEIVTTVDTAKGARAHQWPDVLPNLRGALLTVVRTDASESDVAVLSFETGTVTPLVRGVYGRYASSGHLVYIRDDGGLFAAPFDQAGLRLTGPSTPLLEGVVVKGGGGGGADLTLSETGTMVYQAGEAASNALVWVGRDGVERPLDSDLTRDFESARISPDGRRLAIGLTTEAGDDIWIYDLGQRTLSRLTFDPKSDFRPTWAPDGQTVTFLSERAGPSSAYSAPWDGSGAATALLSLKRGVEDAQWSRDGRWLLYREGGTLGGRDIGYLRPETDTAPTLLLATPFQETSPDLSPDGKWLAYASDETGRQEVYVRPFPEAGGRWQVSTDGGNQPRWAGSGRELFYRSVTGDLVAVEVETSPTFSAGARRRLFSASAYPNNPNYRVWDVTPDDREFLFVKAEGGEADLVVVLNWFEELKRRTAAR